MTPSEAQTALHALKQIAASPEAQGLSRVQEDHLRRLCKSLAEDSLTDGEIVSLRRRIEGARAILAARGWSGARVTLDQNAAATRDLSRDGAPADTQPTP